MSKYIPVILGVIAIFGAAFAIPKYLDRYALCEEVKKVEQKVDKTAQMMEYKFKALQLDTIEDRIYKTEERAGKVPRDPVVKENLEQLKRDKTKVEREMKTLEEKK